MTLKHKILILNLLAILFLILLIFKLYNDRLEIYKFYFYGSFLFLFIIINFIIIFYFKKKVFFQNYILILFSCLFSVYCIELLLLISNNISKKNYEINQKKYQGTVESPKKIFLENFKENEKIFISLSPNDLNSYQNELNFFFTSFSNEINFLCKEADGKIFFRSDRFGFNNIDKLWDIVGTPIFLGDSFVQGWCVKNENNFVNKFTNLNINLGIQNSGPLIQYAILREYLKKISNTKIYWFFYEGNDLEDLSIEKQNKILRKYLISKKFSQNLTERQDEINLVNKKIREAIKSNKIKNVKNKNFYFKNLKNFIALKNIRTELNNKFFIFILYNQIILKTKSLLVEKNIELNVVYLPSYERYINKKLFQNYKYNKILKILSSNNINVIDLKKNFFDKKKNIKKFYAFGESYHFSNLGHSRIASFLKKNLRD